MIAPHSIIETVRIIGHIIVRSRSIIDDNARNEFIMRELNAQNVPREQFIKYGYYVCAMLNEYEQYGICMHQVLPLFDQILTDNATEITAELTSSQHPEEQRRRRRPDQ